MTATIDGRVAELERQNAELRRLLDARTAELDEALDQQKATAEILQIINSSSGDLAPVFEAILRKAHSLCGISYSSLHLYDGERFQVVAARNLPEAFAKLLREWSSEPDNPVRRQLLAGARLVHIADCAELDHPMARAVVEVGGMRTALFVSLRKGDPLLGMIAAGRPEVRPFTEKEIARFESFAAQAVIAIENARLLTETRAALDQQTATAEVLRIINSSPGDLAPVFDAMLERALRLCEGAFGNFWTYDGERLHAVAMRGVPAAFMDFAREPLRPGPETGLGRVLGGERVVHIADVRAGAAYQSRDPLRVATVELAGGRTLLLVPLRKDDALLGIFSVYRQEVRPFSDKQIALVQNFAAQAVIAMENARLLNDLEARTRDLQEALKYQTATSDVLKVISRSSADPDPVLATLVETAARICQADMSQIYTMREGFAQYAAAFGSNPEFERLLMGRSIAPGRNTLVGRTMLVRRVVCVDDAANDPEYWSEAQRIGRIRTGLGVPLLREDELIGVICLARSRVEPFTDRQIELVRTFADQAVIAIENARLLNDLEARTRDLQEALEYQTATSDVLKVISRSTFDLEAVLETVVTTAVRLCRADSAVIYRNDGGEYCWAVGHMLVPEYEKLERAVRIRPGTGTVVGRAAMAGRSVQILDAWTDPLYEAKGDARVGGVHTMIGVPLLRENAPIGVIGLARRRIEAFSEGEIQLVTTFADQAVIAIENARLFDELRTRTAELGRSVDELRLLNEVGQAVSSTLDLGAVLSTILGRSVALTGADAGAVFRYSRAERAFRLVEAAGLDDAYARRVRDLRVAETETVMTEAAARRAPIQLADLATRSKTPLVEASLAAGLHSALVVPLVGPERILGAMVLQRRAAGEFPKETVRLMQTIASQSVLAIQNARLYREIAEKSEQLALASAHKSHFLANMSHELRTPLNAILGYAELLVDGIYGVLPAKARDVLERVQNNGKHLLALINDVLDLAKIEAGQLTLTLEDYSLPEVVRAVVAATEPLAAAKGLKFVAKVQDGMPLAHGDARRVSQVLLNLVGNAVKFTDRGEVEINASAEAGQFVLTVRDTGPGIAEADQERIFGEFQQIDNANTRKQGGTGLGLAISKRMVEMQGGLISVDSVLGRGSAFRVVLPVRVEPALEAAA
jgi:GAF domain-containing protein/anti-sigma regulatory factor (Ser/Thr protein kinase)